MPQQTQLKVIQPDVWEKVVEVLSLGGLEPRAMVTEEDEEMNVVLEEGTWTCTQLVCIVL